MHVLPTVVCHDPKFAVLRGSPETWPPLSIWFGCKAESRVEVGSWWIIPVETIGAFPGFWVRLGIWGATEGSGLGFDAGSLSLKSILQSILNEKIYKDLRKFELRKFLVLVWTFAYSFVLTTYHFVFTNYLRSFELDRKRKFLELGLTFASGFDPHELVFVKDWNKPGILSMGIKVEHFTKFQGILDIFSI